MVSSPVMTPRSSRRRDGRLDRRGLGEAVEPLGELRVLAAPVAGGEAEVEIAERTGDRDRAQGRLALERLGLGLELVEHAVDLLHLALAPVGPALVLGPERRLVARQNGGIEQAVG